MNNVGQCPNFKKENKPRKVERFILLLYISSHISTKVVFLTQKVVLLVNV